MSKRNTHYLIKIGGNVIAQAADRNRIASAIKACLETGVTITIVHGAGPQATELAGKLNIESKKVGGRRITDERMLDVVKMTLGGSVNLDLTAALLAKGIRAWNLSGVTCQIVLAEKRPPKVMKGCGPDPIDFGFVGDVKTITTAPIDLVLEHGYTPVINSLGVDKNGQILNINADTISNHLAFELKVSRLVSITDVNGVLKDIKDPASRIPLLSIEEARALMENGTIKEGMIPKLDSSFEILKDHVEGVHILAIQKPDDLVEELRHSGSRGTFIRIRR